MIIGNDELQSDPESSASGSENEQQAADEVKADAPSAGFFILQHRNAQQNLKELTEQKRKVHHVHTGYSRPTCLMRVLVIPFCS